MLDDLRQGLRQYVNVWRQRESSWRLGRPLPFISDSLPYEAASTMTGRTVLLLKNGALGVGLEVRWPYHLTMNPEGVGFCEAAVNRLISSLGSEIVWQFQTERRRRYSNAGFRSFVFMTSARRATGSWAVKPGSSLAALSDEVGEIARRLIEVAERFAEGARTEVKAVVDWLSETEWMHLLRERLSPEVGAFEHSIPTLQNLCTVDGYIERSAFRLGQVSHKVLVPVRWASGLVSQVSRPLFFADADFLISVAIKPLAGAEARKFIETRRFWLRNALGTRAVRHRTEVDAVDERLARGELVASVCPVVVMFQPTEQEQALLKATLTQATGSDWSAEEWAAAQMTLNTLPLNHDAVLMHRFGRSTVMPFTATVAMAPAVGPCPAGSGTKPLVYPSIEGVPTGFDLRDTPGRHTAVLAGTRSGKSFLVNDILQRYLALGDPPLISIIDKRASYGTLARYHQGPTVSFTPEALASPDFPFHPLTGSLDEQHIEFLTSYLSILATSARPDAPVFAADRVVLTNAIRDAADAARASQRIAGSESAGAITLTMSEIVSALGKQTHEAARVVARQLGPFYGGGAYAKYFDRYWHQPDGSPEASIVSYDLDGLEGDPLLQSAVAQAILGQVMNRMRDASRNGRWGILVVEELGVLGETVPGLAAFVADAWKTMAKLGVMCIGVTNDVLDYLQKPAAQAVWNNSPNKIFLRMTSDQIRSLVTASPHGPAVVTGRAAALLPCLRTRPAKGSDFLVQSEETLLPLRHVPAPRSYWLATTRQEDVVALRRLTETSSIEDAVMRLAESHPRGVEVAQ